MAGTFLENVRAAFLSRSPVPNDRIASAKATISLSRKLLTALVEVGLKEGLSEYAHIERLELDRLVTTQPRRAKIDAVVRATVLKRTLDFRLVGDVEALPHIGNGLTLRFHHLAARGKEEDLDTFIAEAVQKFLLDPMKGTETVIPSVRLAGASIETLSITGSDVVEISLSIRDGVATAPMGF